MAQDWLDKANEDVVAVDATPHRSAARRRQRVSDASVALDIEGSNGWARLYALDLRDERAASADLREKLAAAEGERDHLFDEVHELRQAPWPVWAEACLKIVRDCNGEVDDEVDLPEELEELLSEWDDFETKWKSERTRAEALARDLAAMTEARDAAWEAGRDAAVADVSALLEAWEESVGRGRELNVLDEVIERLRALTPPAQPAKEERSLVSCGRLPGESESEHYARIGGMLEEGEP